MPIGIEKTEGGTAYASPFVGPVDHTAHVQVDVSALTTTQVDSKGYLKPGVVLTLEGVAPVDTTGTPQVETATVAGTIGASGAGNATVIVTSAAMSNSPKTLSVAVANNDTAAQVAGKIRTALAADGDVNDAFSVGGTGASVVLTALQGGANDATLNISVDNGTSTGLTAAPTSANTTPGVAAGSNGTVCMVKEATKIAADNTALASITADPFVACATIAQANRDIVEDNLGRSLNAAEIAALNSARSRIVLLLT
jgi:hypothetical protein